MTFGMSYHAADDTPGLDRAGLGWQSHFNRAEFLAACKAAGFTASCQWIFDGHQSLFKLRPAGAAS
jgi:hypothetical protein